MDRHDEDNSRFFFFILKALLKTQDVYVMLNSTKENGRKFYKTTERETS
jgi:hypothetical protein